MVFSPQDNNTYGVLPADGAILKSRLNQAVASLVEEALWRLPDKQNQDYQWLSELRSSVLCESSCDRGDYLFLVGAV